MLPYPSLTSAHRLLALLILDFSLLINCSVNSECLFFDTTPEWVHELVGLIRLIPCRDPDMLWLNSLVESLLHVCPVQ